MCSPTEALQQPNPTELPPRSSLLANPFADPVVQLLDEMIDVIASLSDEQYARKPVGVMPSSIGAHVRHCLDHVQALLAAVESGVLDYDRRDRGTSIETERCAAIERIALLARGLAALDLRACEREICISMMMTCDGPPVLSTSSIGREMAFVLSHTIHHNAIIGAMVKTLGGRLPNRYGFAPATIARLSRTEDACVRSA